MAEVCVCGGVIYIYIYMLYIYIAVQSQFFEEKKKKILRNLWGLKTQPIFWHMYVTLRSFACVIIFFKYSYPLKNACAVASGKNVGHRCWRLKSFGSATLTWTSRWTEGLRTTPSKMRLRLEPTWSCAAVTSSRGTRYIISSAVTFF